MQAECEVVRFLSAYQAVWHAHFPSLFRRAQWHIVTHLCTTGREGAAVGELYAIWEVGVKENVGCGCGHRFHDCPLWSAVFRRSFGSIGQIHRSHPRVSSSTGSP